MIEKTIVSFGYIPESKLMRTGPQFPSTGSQFPSEQESVMNYSTFEESYLQKQSKMNTKRNTRRRAEQARNNRRCSDAGSDTGSDGVAVNSGGSGRSGDWGPPKIRQKQKYSRRRNEQQRASFTDSGISLAKTDSGDFSEVACAAFDKENNKNGFSDTSHERCHNKPKHVAQHHHNRHGEPNPRSKSDSTAQTSKPHEASMKRSSSCSALPSSIKPLDRHNPRIPAHEIQNRLCAQRNPDEIEAKENAILEQCYRNEGISSNCVEQHCSYVVDCIHGKPSKFPLPERLNYPLNKYYKSDTNLNRLSININLQHPIKKIRSSIRKLKSRSPSSTVLSTPERYEHYSRTTSSNSINDTLDSMDSSYLNYLTESENSEAIMARLASKPSSRKAWVKKVFKWKKLGKLGKTYTPKNDTEKSKNSESIIYSESPSKSLNTRSHSTRSIPDAIKHMWTKLHDVPVHMTEPEPPTTPNLTRASSMPSIASHRISKQKIGDVIYFHEKGFEQNENKNIFQNFFKPMDAQPPKLTSLKGGNDVITSVLGGYEHVSVKNSLADAELSHGKEDLSSRENENNNQASGGKSAVQHYYTSCQDLREHHTPVPYASPAPYSSAGHCPCCGHSQFPHTEQYMDRADMYDSQYQHYQYQNSGHQPVAYYSRSSAPPAVIAPLDVKVSSERKAERRKICEMVFDTFV